MDISRRQFLWITAAITATGAGLYALLGRPSRLRALVDHPRDVARFGAIHACNGFDPDQARQRLLAGMTEDDALDLGAVTETVRRRIEEDSKRADLVLVGGWFVTRAEADLAALIASEQKGPSCT